MADRRFKQEGYRLGWANVDLTIKTVENKVTPNYFEVIDWLYDKDRPGLWEVYGGVNGVYQFYISDPKVAFEFKMRWK